MTSQPRDKTRDSTKHDTAKFGIDLYSLLLGFLVVDKFIFYILLDICINIVITN